MSPDKQRMQITLTETLKFYRSVKISKDWLRSIIAL